MSRFVILVLTLLLIAFGALMYLKRRRPDALRINVNAVTPSQSFEIAAKAQEALALTEGLEPEKGIALWEEVMAAHPDQPRLALNLAVTAVWAYTRLSERIKSNDTSPAEAARLRKTAPAAYEKAEEAVKKTLKGLPDEPAGRWMAARLRMEQATLLPEVLQEGIHREVISEVIKGLEQKPALELVGMCLSEDPGLQELKPKVNQLVARLAETYPRNLVLRLENLQRLVEAKSSQSVEATDQLLEACRPIAPEFENFLGQSVTTLADEVKKGIREQDWPSVEGTVMGWGNVLRPTAPCRSDMQKMNPHVLDFLSTAAVYSLHPTSSSSESSSAQLLESLKLAKQPLDFAEPLSEPVRALVVCDMDLDDRPEVAGLVGDELLVWKIEGKQFRIFARASVSQDDSLLMWADLHLVDSHGPDYLTAKRNPSNEAEGIKFDRAHSTYVSFVVAGSAGVTMWRCNPEQGMPDQRLIKPSKPTGLENVSEVTAMTRGDLDADGDLDLIFGTKTGAQLWINRGNMTFRAATEHSQLPSASSPVVSLAIGDLDRDLDLDLVTLQADGTVGMLENLLHQQFRWLPLDELRASSGGSIEIAELNGDVSWDVVVSSREKLLWGLSATPGSGKWKLQDQGQVNLGSQQMGIADLNADGWHDAVCCGPNGLSIATGSPQPNRAGAMSPAWGFLDSPLVVDTQPMLASVVDDLNDDGKLDCLALTKEGKLELFLNVSSAVGHYLAVRFKGIDDNATGRVNHYAIGTIVEAWFNSQYRSAIIKDRTTRFGLGAADRVTTLRAVFTNGVTQHLVNPTLDTVLEEKQELKGSCPYLYGWDGEKFAFITDCLWAAPLGLQVATGKVAPDRPWEYLLVPGAQVRERNGHYEFRISEELWEIAYFDQIELTAIDHPAGTSVYTNEKVGPPQIAEHKLYALQPWRSPRKAIDHRGNDVLAHLNAVDQVFVQGFDRRIFQGLTPQHWIELDAGELESGDRVVLALTGWILPTDSSLNIAIDQNPDLAPQQFPSVWVPEGEGWREAIPFLGFPGGKTKTIVTDLTDVIRTEDPRIQIRTTAQIYWDRAVFAINPEEVPVKTQPVPLVSAELGWHGFSQLLPRRTDEPQRYDYQAVMNDPKWPPLGGAFTRYGPVKELLERWDDRMVAMGPGDEIRLKFALPTERPDEGWVRDFVLHNVGWDKDADLNTLSGQSVEPMPYRAMGNYPRSVLQTNRSGSSSLEYRDRFQSYRRFWRR